jgi:hypothetical protein
MPAHPRAQVQPPAQGGGRAGWLRRRPSVAVWGVLERTWDCSALLLQPMVTTSICYLFTIFRGEPPSASAPSNYLFYFVLISVAIWGSKSTTPNLLSFCLLMCRHVGVNWKLDLLLYLTYCDNTDLGCGWLSGNIKLKSEGNNSTEIVWLIVSYLGISFSFLW